MKSLVGCVLGLLVGVGVSLTLASCSCPVGYKPQRIPVGMYVVRASDGGPDSWSVEVTASQVITLLTRGQAQYRVEYSIDGTR